MISEILYANARRRICAGEVLEYTLSQLSALPWKNNLVVARTLEVRAGVRESRFSCSRWKNGPRWLANSC